LNNGLFMKNVRSQGRLSSVDILQTGKGSIFRDFVRMSFMEVSKTIFVRLLLNIGVLTLKLFLHFMLRIRAELFSKL